MKKIGIILIIVIVAMGAIGAGYAAWQQTLNINTSVAMATFDVNFTSKIDATAPTGGTATATIVDGKHVTISVTNAYPGYTGVFTTTVTNSSTIPVSAVLAETLDADNICAVTPVATATIPAATATDTTDTKEYTITVTIPPEWVGSEHSGGTFTATYTIVASQPS